MQTNPVITHLDTRYLIQTLERLARVPADVPMGSEVFIEPDDPKLVHYVQNVLRPELSAIGAYDLIDAPGNQIIRHSPDSLLVRGNHTTMPPSRERDLFHGRLIT